MYVEMILTSDKSICHKCFILESDYDLDAGAVGSVVVRAQVYRSIRRELRCFLVNILDTVFSWGVTFFWGCSTLADDLLLVVNFRNGL